MTYPPRARFSDVLVGQQHGGRECRRADFRALRRTRLRLAGGVDRAHRLSTPRRDDRVGAEPERFLSQLTRGRGSVCSSGLRRAAASSSRTARCADQRVSPGSSSVTTCVCTEDAVDERADQPLVARLSTGRQDRNCRAFPGYRLRRHLVPASRNVRPVARPVRG